MWTRSGEVPPVAAPCKTELAQEHLWLQARMETGLYASSLEAVHYRHHRYLVSV